MSRWWSDIRRTNPASPKPATIHHASDSLCHVHNFCDPRRCPLPFPATKSLHCQPMSIPTQPNVKLNNAPDYKENYPNSVQMRVTIWDFFLVFATLHQQTETQFETRPFLGISLSPPHPTAPLCP